MGSSWICSGAVSGSKGSVTTQGLAAMAAIAAVAAADAHPEAKEEACDGDIGPGGTKLQTDNDFESPCNRSIIAVC